MGEKVPLNQRKLPAPSGNTIPKRPEFLESRRAANVDVLKAQDKCLRNEIKIFEKDKRNENELGNTTSNLTDEIATLKTEIMNLTSIASMLEKENSILKQKYDETGIRFNRKPNKQKIVTQCSGKDASNEVCCDAVQNVITSLIELVKNELKCSICDDILIDPTLTNCNHMFCSYCLKKWKKRKNQCPYCRAEITIELKAKAVDEYITSLSKLICDKMYTERIQMMNDRKPVVAAAVPRKKVLNARSRIFDRGFSFNSNMNYDINYLVTRTERLPSVPPTLPLRVPISVNNVVRHCEFFSLQLNEKYSVVFYLFYLLLNGLLLSRE